MFIKKLKVLLLYVLACILLLFSACQQTPEKQAVVNKASSSLDEMVLEKADPNEEWPPEGKVVWSETRTVDNKVTGQYTVDVSIDAKTPERPNRVPIVVIEPERFDIDLLTKVARYLMAGDIYEGTPSKQDVAAEILDFKKDISTHTIIDGYQDQVDEELKSLNDRYEETADGNSEAKFEGTKNLRLKSYSDGGNIMHFEAFGSRFDFRNTEFNRSYENLNDEPDKSVQANGIKTTYEQARAIADEAMTAVFSERYAMVHSNILDKVNLWGNLWKDGDYTSLGQAYVFYYSPIYDGFASLYIEPAPVFEAEESNETEFAKPYPREYACIVVDDNGIANMHYESISSTVKKINDDVKLMPFADILERFKDEVFYHNLWGTSKTEIKVTRIEFGLVREPVKDNQDQYMMVPAWNFIGDINSGWANEQGVSIIALNAINGSVITDYAKVF